MTVHDMTGHDMTSSPASRTDVFYMFVLFYTTYMHIIVLNGDPSISVLLCQNQIY
jgi:hypothetical protein